MKIQIVAAFSLVELVHNGSIIDLQIAFIIINVLYSIISIALFTDFLIKHSKQIQKLEAK